MPANQSIKAVEDYVQVSASLLVLVQDYLDQQSLDAASLRAELASFARLERVPIDTWWRILEQVGKLDPRPGLGLRIGLLTRPHHVGVLGYLAMSCATLAEAMGCFQRFQSLLQNLAPITISPIDDGFRLAWDKTYGRSTQHSRGVVVGIALAFARGFTGVADLSFRGVTFPGDVPPEQQADYDQLMNCPVTFAADCLSLDISAEAMNLSIKSHDPYMQTLMTQQAETLVSVLPHPDALMAQIKRTIDEALKEGEPSMKYLCQQMDVTPGFIYRCLRRRNLTFKAVVNEIRRQRSLDYLTDPTLQLSEVASLLGYSEQSAFTRAFRSWYQVTPLRFRREGLQGSIIG